METVRIQKFIESNSDFHDGCGGGNGSGGGYDEGYGYGDGSGSGYGYIDGLGDGSGYGSGNGRGSGDGGGEGSGYGYGRGSGDGSGEGYDIKCFCDQQVYKINGIQTIITAVFGDTAKGYVLRDDLTLVPCYIAKKESHFAHGETLAQAIADVAEKAFNDMPEEDRIAEFWKCHQKGVKYPARDLYEWHHRLTGSCEMGRIMFAAENGIDLNSDMFTVAEFVELCGKSYGGEIIRRLSEWSNG